MESDLSLIPSVDVKVEAEEKDASDNLTVPIIDIKTEETGEDASNSINNEDHTYDGSDEITQQREVSSQPHSTTDEIFGKTQENFECEFCNASFTERTIYFDHLAKIHYPGDRLYPCNICNKVFTRSSRLDLHLKRHSTVRPFQCNLCNRSYLRATDLNRHTKTHTVKQSHACDQCNKCFMQKSHLTAHKKVHTGGKP